MIIEIELVDFLSHRMTDIKFEPGMNVIVGPNGAGKSSIVDAVTFALFGKHMRKVNKLLIRHGATSGYATVIFESGDRRFKATRKLKAGGAATPTLYERSGESWVNVAAGERRQMDESTTREIEGILGMNFEKMQIASIIRQGELADIVRESPKEFKTRINDIIGNSDLDVADGNMADLLAGFRNNIRNRFGHDDTQLSTITATLESDKAESRDVKAKMRTLSAERAKGEAGIKTLEAELARAEEGARAQDALEARSAELAEYARQRGEAAAADRDKISGEAAECRRRLGEYEAGGGVAGGGAAAMKARVVSVEAELARAEEGARAQDALEARSAELAEYARQRGEAAAADRDKISGEAAECSRLFDVARTAGEVSTSLKEARRELEAESELVAAGEKTMAVLKEQTTIAGKLTLKDGKCPVCDSRVSNLKPLFVIEHIKDEIERASTDMKVHKEAVRRHASKIDELKELERKAMEAKSTLDAHNVSSMDDIEAMSKRAATLEEMISMAEACARGDWQAGAGIDSQARAHCKAIAALEKTAGAGGRPVEELEVELASVRHAIGAAAFLEAHSVSSAADIEVMERKAGELRAVVEMAEACARGDWQAGAGIDSQAGAHCKAIATLEERVRRSGGRSVAEITAELKDAKSALDGINKRHGGAEERARALADSISQNDRLFTELETVSAYVKRLNSIRDAFRRDGSVATSLRSWALNEISRGSTEHLSLLDTRINRITLTEKDRNVTITCHSGVTTSDVYALSGGEQVCIALALRLGMARLLGPSGPRYVILDEPTAHLDEERRKALAYVLTNLSGASRGKAPMQFIMITHDAEIFDEVPVEKCYKFEPGERGTVVSELGHGD